MLHLASVASVRRLPQPLLAARSRDNPEAAAVTVGISPVHGRHMHDKGAARHFEVAREINRHVPFLRMPVSSDSSHPRSTHPSGGKQTWSPSSELEMKLNIFFSCRSLPCLASGISFPTPNYFALRTHAQIAPYSSVQAQRFQTALRKNQAASTLPSLRLYSTAPGKEGVRCSAITLA